MECKFRVHQESRVGPVFTRQQNRHSSHQRNQNFTQSQFSIPGCTTVRSDRNQFSGVVMPIINNKIRHDQYYLPNLTGLEATAICLYLQNHRRLLFVLVYLLPTSILPLTDSVILVGDRNSKHAAWHNKSGNRNGRILLSYCVNKDITLSYPDQPTHFPHNSTPSVLDITLSKRCPTPKPQAVPTLSSDHNPIVFKILFHPLITKPVTLYDYKHANWSLFRTSLELSIPSFPYNQ